MAEKMLKIELKKSLIGRSAKQIATANSLGLKKPGDVAVQPDNTATQGKVALLSFMLNVTEAAAPKAAKKAAASKAEKPAAKTTKAAPKKAAAPKTEKAAKAPAKKAAPKAKKEEQA